MHLSSHCLRVMSRVTLHSTKMGVGSIRYRKKHLRVFFHFDPATGSLHAEQTISTLPPGFKGTSFTSEILLSSDGGKSSPAIDSTIRSRSSFLAVKVDSHVAVKPQPGEITQAHTIRSCRNILVFVQSTQ